ncbi:F-box only protein 6 [Spatholobus suberectus]|nr:F-box only protein 6 [Spatholobus suberectus]
MMMFDFLPLESTLLVACPRQHKSGVTYETNVEMYNSQIHTWQVVGSMSIEFAIRLTVWTPNENMCIKKTLYWITSAIAYHVMGFNVGTGRWKEMGVPMAKRLEFATIVRQNKALVLVGGTCGASACIWELNEWDKWCLVDKVPLELGLRLLLGKIIWESAKCVVVVNEVQEWLSYVISSHLEVKWKEPLGVCKFGLESTITVDIKILSKAYDTIENKKMLQEIHYDASKGTLVIYIGD